MKAETDIKVKEVRDAANARVAEAKAALDKGVEEAVSYAADVKAQYTAAISRLTQWLAPGALASMGHSVSRRGRKSS